MKITSTATRKVRAVSTDENEVRIEISVYQGQIYDDNRRKWSHDAFSLSPAELLAIARLLDEAR